MDVVYINPMDEKIADAKEIALGMLPEWFSDSLGWNVECAVNTETGEMIGIMCTSYFKNTIEIEWIYIVEKYRRMNCAGEFIEHFLDIVDQLDRVFNVNVTFTDEKEDLMWFFLQSPRFVNCEIGHIYDVTGAEIHASEHVRSILEYKTSQPIVSFEKMSDMDRSCLALDLESIKENSALNLIRSGNNIVKDMSYVIYGQNKEIQACIIVTDLGDNKFELAYMYSKDPRSCAEVMAAALVKIPVSEEFHLKIRTISEKSGILAAKIFNGIEPTGTIYEGTWNFTTRSMLEG